MPYTINPGVNTLNVTMTLITGSLTGVVSDAVGPLSGVLATLGTGASAKTATTNTSGVYTITAIVPADYPVKFEKAGYVTETR